MKKAFLLLADGTLFEGTACGYEGKSIGEVVFNTGMAGYQEVLTDPSYYGQIVTMTYPLVGNYGINFEDYESHKSWVSGFIMREICEYPSNWRCRHTLDDYLKSQKVVGLQGIDTRRLTRILRNSGVMNGIIYTEGHEPTEQDIADMKDYIVKDAVSTVTCNQPSICKAEGETKYRVALLDFGVKYNIERELQARGCEVTILPGDTEPNEIINGGYDGVMLTNGPGDPAENVEIIKNIKVLVEANIPMFGICLGHQLMALSIGAQTKKMRFGHRGVNHPVKDLQLDRTYITSQNHGYAVVAESVNPEIATVRYVNLNDNSVEGLDYVNHPVFTVQFHPEVCPGPQDTSFLFDRFLSNIENGGNK